MMKPPRIALLLMCLILPLWGSGDQQRLETYLSARLAGRTEGADLRCAFAYALQLIYVWPELNPELKSALRRPYLAPPQLQDSLLSPSGYFMLHFDRSGTDAVPAQDVQNNGIPDYIDSAAVILDEVRNIEVDMLGFQPPLGVDGNPEPLYQVYFQELGFEYGVTFPLDPIPGPPGFFRFTSYIVMDNDYQDSGYFSRGLQALKVTTAHEFNHAIQLSSRIWAENGEPQDLFLMEMTSTWLEDVLYEEVNDYFQYLPFFFQIYSNTPFSDDFYLYPFGNSLFLHMLEKQFGAAIGRRIWDRIIQQPGLDALAAVLSEAGSSFITQLHQYGIWLSFTGERADPLNFFPESASYPSLIIDPDDELLFDQSISATWMISPLASRVLQFEQVRGGEYRLTVNSNRTPGKVSHLIPQGIASTISVNQSGLLYLLNDETIQVLITNGVRDSANVKYQLTRGPDITRESLVAFPNPVVIPQDQTLAFINIPEEGEIYIFNSNGERIAAIEVPPLPTTVFWDLKDEYNRQVSSGSYLYLFIGEHSQESGKIAIIR